MKGLKWNPKIHDWDIVEVTISNIGNVENAEKAETLLPRAEMSKFSRQWRKLLFGSSKAKEQRL